MNKENQINRTLKNSEDAISDGLDMLKDKACEYEKSVRSSIEPIYNRGQDLTKDAGAWVKKNPVAAAGIALAAGVVIGKILLSRSNRD